MGTATYVNAAELPSLTYEWSDQDGVLYADMATGWTFQVLIIDGSTTVLTKTTGITGAATAPNVTVAWSAGERNAVGDGTYTLRLTATRTADSKRRIREDTLVIV